MPIEIDEIDIRAEVQRGTEPPAAASPPSGASAADAAARDALPRLLRDDERTLAICNDA